MSEDGVASCTSLEAALGYTFRTPALLETALQHASFAHESGRLESNERLEFLGDAVLGLVVAELLYAAHPDWREGDLTRGLHSLVDQVSLAAAARRIDLGVHLQLGRTEQRSGGADKDSILSDAIEAVLAAVYLDRGLPPVIALVRRMFGEALSSDAPKTERDPKTLLQERVMASVGEFPRYVLIDDNEIEGDEYRFTVEVRVSEEQWGRGTARSKRLAERLAAADAAVAHPEAALGPDAAGPDAASPDALSLDSLSPDALSPDAHSPDADGASEGERGV